MDRIKDLFQRKQKNILSIYCTAGFPGINDTETIIQSLASAGADMIEIGIPFSDPVADGSTIQQSNTTALQNGMSIQLLFQQLQNIRKHVHIPLILMSYLNPILQYGIKEFCIKAKACGIDGVIIPDLPVREYQDEYEQTFKTHHVKFIFLITPQTSTERIRMIDSLSDAFIYMVTSSATTGSQKNAMDITSLQRVASLQLNNPILAGFGIHDHHTFQTICQHVNGAIIGSAFIRALSKNTSQSIPDSVTNFINSIYNDHPANT